MSSAYQYRKSCYGILNNSCLSQTIALTSNDKFFPLLDPVYYTNWVPIRTLDARKIPIDNGFAFNRTSNPKNCIEIGNPTWREYH